MKKPDRIRRGINQSFYLLKEGQEFIAARSIPVGDHGHRDCSASNVLTNLIATMNWIIQTNSDAVEELSERDIIVIMRCLPGLAVLARMTPAEIALIPEVVRENADHVNIAKVMGIKPLSVVRLVKKLESFSALELLVLHDRLICLHIEFMKQETIEQ